MDARVTLQVAAKVDLVPLIRDDAVRTAAVDRFSRYRGVVDVAQPHANQAHDEYRNWATGVLPEPLLSRRR
jgi:hypothetical protein